MFLQLAFSESGFALPDFCKNDNIFSLQGA